MIDIRTCFVISVFIHFLFFSSVTLFQKTSSKIYYIPIQVIGYGSGGVAGGIGGGGGSGTGSLVRGNGLPGGGPAGGGDVSATDAVQKGHDVVRPGDIIASKIVSKSAKVSKKDVLKWEKGVGGGIGKGEGSGTGTGTGTGAGGGFGGGVSVDAGQFPYIGYVNILRNKVAQNWNPAPYTSAGSKKVLVYFKILKNGKVENLTIKESAGLSFIDRSAIRAITNSSPFPPLPMGFPDDSLGVYFMFELSGS